MSSAITGIRRLVGAPDTGDLTDGQLLERFAARRDEVAFAILVRRHGAMVLGTCRSVLGHHHDAEDAFQAAFLVLARKAGSVRWQRSAGGWLFRVAYRIALRLRIKADRQSTEPLPDIAGPDRGADPDLRAILDEELSRLPEKYRAVVLLCCCEGTTRAEAARRLGWKEGAVKVRLERGRELLRTRLKRRGLTPTALLVGSLLGHSEAPAAVPAALVAATVSAARLFCEGTISAATPAAVAAEGVLKTMGITRMKTVALLVLAFGTLALGAGLWAFSAPPSAEAPPAPREAPARRRAEVAPALARDPAKPLRVLLFAGAPTREYQFVRAYFTREAERERAEMRICLQVHGGRGVLHEVPAERMLKEFPTRLTSRDKKGEAEARLDDLAAYDVVIAFDPDWWQLGEEQTKLLEKWVRAQGGGLIFLAGPINTLRLARPGADAKERQPIRDLLPVRLLDSRLALGEAGTTQPWALKFPAPEKFLKLDEAGKADLAGWSEFFFDKDRPDWQTTDDRPVRGFYSAYPLQGAKPDAKVIATFRDPNTAITTDDGKVFPLPYLVTMPYGKGRTVYLGSGETWRLRQYRESCFERFWDQLSRHAAGAKPVRADFPGDRAPASDKRRRATIDSGLKWLVANQFRDGHWDDGYTPMTTTALCARARRHGCIDLRRTRALASRG